MVAGAEGSRDVVARDESEAKPVARRLMLLRVVLKVVPQVVGERVFVRNVSVEIARELRPFGGEFRELERAPRLEPIKMRWRCCGTTLCALMIFK